MEENDDKKRTMGLERKYAQRQRDRGGRWSIETENEEVTVRHRDRNQQRERDGGDSGDVLEDWMHERRKGRVKKSNRCKVKEKQRETPALFCIQFTLSPIMKAHFCQCDDKEIL